MKDYGDDGDLKGRRGIEMQHKHAYMIIAHNEFYVLEKLVSAIDDSRNDIFIHIDKKVKEFEKIRNHINGCVKKSNIYFVPRIKVVWGGYSQIECEISLFEAVLKKGIYSYCHLISGVDMPLKTQNEIHDYFSSIDGTNFISYVDNEKYLEQEKRRFIYWRPFTELRGRQNKTFFSFVEGVLIQVQKMVGVNRNKNLEKDYSLGSNWISVKPEILEIIVSEKEWIKKTFNMTKCCDEIYKQTLLKHTKFYESRYVTINHYGNLDPSYEDCLRAVQIEGGKPYIWNIDDFEYLISSDMLFCRKCSGKNQDDRLLVNRLYEFVRLI